MILCDNYDIKNDSLNWIVRVLAGAADDCRPAARGKTTCARQSGLNPQVNGSSF